MTPEQSARSALKSAKDAVDRPLKFGDVEQIKAVRFLEQVSELMQHMRVCRHCRDWEICPDGQTFRFSDEVWDAAMSEFWRSKHGE